ncbi:signal peptidase I [Candidatus Woesearchaeota archaeon]|nr:signal peptidase I [Candidatus Woesearchaeota archaeon]
MLLTLGWLANDTYQTLGIDENVERAKSVIVGLPARAMPADRISEDKIKVLPDRIIIDVPNARWATFTPTHSMAPVFDIGSNALQIIPQTPEEIQVGDIVSYTWKDGSVIIHRVIEIGSDEQGWFAILKGDNNPVPDPEKVRFEQIKRVTIAIVY